MADGGMLHEGTNQVVGDDVEDEFLFNHLRAQAAQNIEGESDFDFPAKEQKPRSFKSVLVQRECPKGGMRLSYSLDVLLFG